MEIKTKKAGKVEAPGGAGAMILLPPAPGACQVCAAKHEPQEPHNAESLYWGMCAKMKGQPSPTWKAALAHCAPATKKIWKAELRKRGVKI